jgi:hypothetical protein
LKPKKASTFSFEVESMQNRTRFIYLCSITIPVLDKQMDLYLAEK